MVFFEIRERGSNPGPGRKLLIGTPHELELVDMIDIDAELLHPLGGVDDGGVNSERTSADQAIGEAAEPPRCRNRDDLRTQPCEHALLRNVPKALRKGDASLVERPGVCQHPDESRVLRVDVREHHDRLWAELRRHARVLRPRPDGEVEDDGIDARGRHHPAVAHGDVVLPDHRVASDDVEPAGLEPLDQLLTKLPVYRLERLLQVTAAVTEIENADADPGGLKVIEHDTSLCHSDRAG